MASDPLTPDSTPAGAARIVSHRIDPSRLEADARVPGAGAVVQFVGTVRDRTDDAAVVELHYEAYVEMADATLADIVHRARETWPILHAAVVHRIGTLKPGDVSVCVTVAAPHRDAAFAACRHIIDTLKQRAPIWKRETFQSGQRRWVEESLPPADPAHPAPPAG